MTSLQAMRAVAFARKQVGKPYIFGGTGPDGYDCSGLMMAAYASAGVTLPRTSEAQWAAPFPKVEWGHWLAGDLIFSDFNDGQPSPGHVVMYYGGGMVIAAPHTGTNVQIEPVSDFKTAYVGSSRPGRANRWRVKNGKGHLIGDTLHPVLFGIRHPKAYRDWEIVTYERHLGR